jgi:hypothetical protein
MVFVAVVYEKLHQDGHGLVGDVSEVEVPHCLDHISRVRSTLGLRRHLSGSLNGKKGRSSMIAYRGRRWEQR